LHQGGNSIHFGAFFVYKYYVIYLTISFIFINEHFKCEVCSYKYYYMLQKVYASHKKWINTTLKFGCSLEEAEDIVGDMYAIIGKMLKNGLNIAYGDDVNYYYIYRTLKSSFLQMKNRQNKENKVPLDLVLDIESGEYIDFDKANETMQEELDKMHWYDKKVYNLIQDEYSITELSNKTSITYHSLYNTYRKTKDKLKDKIKNK